MNWKDFFETKVPEKVAADPDKFASMKGAKYQFNLTGDNGANYCVDFTGDTPVVTPGTAAEGVTCTVTAADADFAHMVDGSLNSQMAFMTGKLKIAGDMGQAMKLNKLIG